MDHWTKAEGPELSESGRLLRLHNQPIGLTSLVVIGLGGRIKSRSSLQRRSVAMVLPRFCDVPLRAPQ